MSQRNAEPVHGMMTDSATGSGSLLMTMTPASTGRTKRKERREMNENHGWIYHGPVYRSADWLICPRTGDRKQIHGRGSEVAR